MVGRLDRIPTTNRVVTTSVVTLSTKPAYNRLGAGRGVADATAVPDRRGRTMQQECYEFRCSDIGMECSFAAKAHSEGELMEKVSRHAADVHNMTEVDQRTISAIKGAVKVNHEC